MLKPNLRAVEKSEPVHPRQIARNAINRRNKKLEDLALKNGQLIGESFSFRGWPKEVVLAFLEAPIIKRNQGK